MQSRRPDSPETDAAEPQDRASQTSLTKPPAAPAATRESVRESLRVDGASRESVRRDPRAEDDSPVVARVDVVSVDHPRSTDPASSALGTLRRELGRLQQQAATVERTLEDHRRDRSEHAAQFERAQERASDLDKKLAEASERIEGLTEERDSLSRALEEAKTTTEALDAQLTDVRKRQYQESLKVTEKDTEISGLKQKLEKIEAEGAKAKKEASEAKEAATKTKAEAEKAKKEAKEKSDKELATLRADLAKAKTDREADASQNKIERDADAVRARNALESSKKELSEREAAASLDRTALEMTKRELADRESALAAAKKELAEARASIAAAESRAIAAESKSMSSAATAAREEARAIAAEEARGSFEESVRELRRDVAVAFSRLEAAAPPPVLRGSAAPAPINSEMPQTVAWGGDEPAAPVVTPTREPESGGVSSGTAAPPPGLAVPPPAGAANGSAKPPETAAAAAIDLRTVEDSEVPPSRMQTAPPARAPSEAPEITSSEEEISVPPEGAASLAPEDLFEDDPVSKEEVRIAPVPPTPHLSALASAIDAAWGNQSAPPPAPVIPPPGASAPPRPLDIAQRTELFAKLVDPDHGRDAAEELRKHPEWLVGAPPPTFLAALVGIDYDSEAPVFELARAWDRDAICHALVADLQTEEEARLREHTAWLLKHLAVPSACKALADIAKSDKEPVQLRRWLLEALDRLAAGRSVSWPELGETVTALAHHPDATIRDGVVGILTSLERSDEKGRMLMEILKKDDDEGVLSSAVEALASVLPIELDPSVAERLLGHKSTRVQRSVRELIDRARRESRRPPAS